MKKYYIVDTNVPVVANGKSPQASTNCVLACIEIIDNLQKDNYKLVLDDNWLIIKEYQKNLSHKGQPGIGDAFLKWVLTNRKNPNRINMVKITPKNNNNTDFNEFPNDPGLTNFDPEDKKFIAVSIAHNNHPPIIQGVDCKWYHFKNHLKKFNVELEFICQEELKKYLQLNNMYCSKNYVS